MRILNHLRNILCDVTSNDKWALLGVFLFIAAWVSFCGKSGSGKKTGCMMAFLKALVFIIVIGLIVGKLT